MSASPIDDSEYLEDDETGEKIFEIPLDTENSEYLSLKLLDRESRAGIPGVYRAEISSNLDYKEFEQLVSEYTGTVNTGVDSIDINTGEEVRTAKTGDRYYVEFPSGVYHNITLKEDDQSLSIEVRDTTVRPLEKWLESTGKNPEEMETAIRQARTLIGEHLEEQ